mgnify:CR=1 FL=1
MLLRRRKPVEQTMLLEDQQVNYSISDVQVEDAIRDMSPRAFWD